MKVQNLESSKGNKVANQFEIFSDAGVHFQSDNSIIAFIPKNSKTQLDKKYWNYSKTTSKYLAMFLGMSNIEVKKKVAKGEFILTDLN